jgi:hypothetical protein
MHDTNITNSGAASVKISESPGSTHMRFAMTRIISTALLTLWLSLGTAAAQNCGSYPNTLTNGQTADANQVMANFSFVLNCVNGLTNGTTPFGFVLQGGQLQTSVASNNLTIAIKTTGGADPSTNSPVIVVFRDQTALGGNQNTVNITAPTSFTINSGSTLGTSNGAPFRVWVVGFNDGGTFRLGVINCSTATAIYPLVEYGLPSSTGGNGGNSAGAFYTGTAVTSKPFRILGYMEWSTGLTTAGVWATAPTTLQLFGPGIKKPGDIVQGPILGTRTSTTTTTSGSFVTTNITASITPTSPVNLVHVQYTSDRAASTGSAQQLTYQLTRVSTQIGHAQALSGSSNFFTCAGIWLDAPYTTNGTAYAPFFETNAGQTATMPVTSGTILLWEVMGSLEPANDNARLRMIG